jgi:hypothetical protein
VHRFIQFFCYHLNEELCFNPSRGLALSLRPRGAQRVNLIDETKRNRGKIDIRYMDRNADSRANEEKLGKYRRSLVHINNRPLFKGVHLIQ